jgi:hypothetical protein
MCPKPREYTAKVNAKRSTAPQICYGEDGSMKHENILIMHRKIGLKALDI